MDQDLSSSNEFLERQITLLRELAGSLERAQAAILQSDVGQMRAQTLRQQNLCEQLLQRAGQAAPEQAALMPSGVKPVPGATPLPALTERQQSLLTELRHAGWQVERLNREYEALLRRARRAVDIFCRVLANSGITYLPPTSRAQARPLKG